MAATYANSQRGRFRETEEALLLFVGKGLADRRLSVFQAMMKTYSHVRRKALDEAAAVLEPVVVVDPPKTGPGEQSGCAIPEAVTSQLTSQSASDESEANEIIEGIGSSGWIRTSNPPVNSRMLYH